MNGANDFLKIIFRRRKILIIIFCASALLSIVFSGKQFMQPLYKSTAVLYPINTFSYSQESPTEQMLQILDSRDLHFDIIDSLRLSEHYNIDSHSPFSKEKVLKKFRKRVSVQRTRYESVKIDAIDTSPEMAFKIVNCIIDSYNKLCIKLLRKKAEEIFIIRNDLFLKKQHEVDSLKTLVDSLIRISNLAEYNILRESMRGNYQYLSSLQSKDGNKPLLSAISLDLFYNQKLLENELTIYIDLKNKYELALSDTQKELEFSDIISAPAIPEKPSFPLRLLIIGISVVATMFFSICVFIILEKISPPRS